MDGIGAVEKVALSKRKPDATPYGVLRNNERHGPTFQTKVLRGRHLRFVGCIMAEM